jgi:hypothetical protein
MRLGADDAKITIGRDSLHLRPSLRACHRLEQKYGGFPSLFREVEAGSLTAISDIIKEGSGHTSALSDYLDSPDAEAMLVNLDAIGAQILNFVLSLTSIESDREAETGEAISYLEYHTRLFQIARTPTTAWEATPAEIIEAQKGLMQKFKAIYGGANSDDDTLELDDPAARGQLNALGDLTVTTMPEVPLCA